jgi:hypothetical protein
LNHPDPVANDLLQHLLVKLRHQVRGRFVVDAPLTDDYSGRARIHKPARQPDQPFASTAACEMPIASALFNGQPAKVAVRKHD